MSEHSEVVREIEATKELLASVGSNGPMDKSVIGRLDNLITRISTTFAMEALLSVDLHHLDEDLSEGKLDARFVPVITSAVQMADPAIFPSELRGLANSLKESLLKLQVALTKKDLESSASNAHLAHERFHELQHESDEWLSKRP